MKAPCFCYALRATPEGSPIWSNVFVYRDVVTHGNSERSKEFKEVRNVDYYKEAILPGTASFEFF
jgi:hypothetical protein